MIRIRRTIALVLTACALSAAAKEAELVASQEPGWPQWRGPRRDGYLYHMNANGRLACLDATNGSEVWNTPILEKYVSQNITWGISESPLVADGKVYVTPAGQGALMVALDAKSGWQIWQTDALEGETPAYSSAIMLDTDQGRQIISGSSDHTFGVDAVTGRLTIYADGKFYGLRSDGKMMLLEAAAKELRILSEFDFISSRKDVWAHPVICDGRLYLRYDDTLYCYDIKKP